MAQFRILPYRFMKVYNLSCAQDHRFEGWFTSEDDFQDQVAKGQLECPLCGSSSISRLPAAPRLNLSGVDVAPADAHAVFQAKLMEFARQVIANTEDVGADFAEEARRIHYKETPMRGIRGTATSDECAALADEGIDVYPLPLPDALKQNLQ